MAPAKDGESHENKSQTNDVRRNNIIAAKGACPCPSCVGLLPLRRWLGVTANRTRLQGGALHIGEGLRFTRSEFGRLRPFARGQRA